MGNTYAFMAQRGDRKDKIDDFPTPPWATRALCEKVLKRLAPIDQQTCLEPAAGRGWMAEALKEYFGTVIPRDVLDYGYGETGNFITAPPSERSVDWCISNPPFSLCEDFIHVGMRTARIGVSMITRSTFTEGGSRFERLWSKYRAPIILQFSERVPMLKGRMDGKASSATAYCWVTFLVNPPEELARPLWFQPRAHFIWTGRCRKQYERPGDYDAPVSIAKANCGPVLLNDRQPATKTLPVRRHRPASDSKSGGLDGPN
jgi:hypothetical protein